jgi:hypothetical protein
MEGRHGRFEESPPSFHFVVAAFALSGHRLAKP